MRLARRRIAGKRNNPCYRFVEGQWRFLATAAGCMVIGLPTDRQRVRVVQPAEGGVKVGKCNVADSEQVRSIGW